MKTLYALRRLAQTPTPAHTYCAVVIFFGVAITPIVQRFFGDVPSAALSSTPITHKLGANGAVNVNPHDAA